MSHYALTRPEAGRSGERPLLTIAKAVATGAPAPLCRPAPRGAWSGHDADRAVRVAGRPRRYRPDQVVQPVLRSAQHQCVGLVLIGRTGRLTGHIPGAGRNTDVQSGRRARGERVASSARSQASASASRSAAGTTDVPGSYDTGTGVMQATSSGRPARRAGPGAHAGARRLAVGPS